MLFESSTRIDRQQWKLQNANILNGYWMATEKMLVISSFINAVWYNENLKDYNFNRFTVKLFFFHVYIFHVYIQQYKITQRPTVLLVLSSQDHFRFEVAFRPFFIQGNLWEKFLRKTRCSYFEAHHWAEEGVVCLVYSYSTGEVGMTHRFFHTDHIELTVTQAGILFFSFYLSWFQCKESHFYLSKF